MTEAGIPGPLETWESDDDPLTIDWPGTLTAGPRVIPGVTTRRRTSVDEPPPTRRTSVWLDLYLDGSGSMPSPALESPAVLAATILVASVLRVPGGRVRVTTFSGPGQVAGTRGFTRNRTDATAALLTYPGGGTTFPLDLLAARSTERRAAGSGGRHLVVLSDDGLASMFGEGQPAYAGVAARVAAGLDTATLMLLDAAQGNGGSRGGGRLPGPLPGQPGGRSGRVRRVGRLGSGGQRWLTVTQTAGPARRPIPRAGPWPPGWPAGSTRRACGRSQPTDRPLRS